MSHIDSRGSGQDCAIDREVGYDGNGEGTLDCGSDGSCDLTYVNWVCTRDCDDGSSGSCFAANTSLANAAPRVHLLPSAASRMGPR